MILQENYTEKQEGIVSGQYTIESTAHKNLIRIKSVYHSLIFKYF